MPVQGQNFDFYLRFEGYELQIKYHFIYKSRDLMWCPALFIYPEI
jgi:hypothetical protein